MTSEVVDSGGDRVTSDVVESGVRTNALARRFGDALRAGHGANAEAVIEAALAEGIGAADIHALVIAPALVRIGELWEQRIIGVAEEHLATAISERALMRIFVSLTAGRPTAPARERILLAGSVGQHHVLGLRMVADVLEGAGFDVVHLGADMPVSSLTAYVEENEPAVVGLSVGMAVEISGLADTLGAIHDCAPATRIMLGGRAVPPGFRVGGYPYLETSQGVVQVVEALLAGPPQPLPPIVDLLRTGEPMRSWSTAPSAPDPVADGLARVAEHAYSVARDHVRRAETFRDLAFSDPLTGMANRRAFDDRLHQLTAGNGTPGALLMLDIDSFKDVNDVFGHDTGDELLRTVGQAIRSAVRPEDLAARFGGDEFAVLLPGCEPQLAFAIAERIRLAVATDPRRNVTVSVGVATMTDDPRAALLAADTALYEAKRLGRDRVVSAGPGPQPAGGG
jgi:diguanylate cyclase (GGDEF)-like protein